MCNVNRGRRRRQLPRGCHCAQPILRRFGAETTVRPLLAFYNSFDGRAGLRRPAPLLIVARP
jgi:hypothetical protein